MATDLETKLDELIKSVTNRNAEIQAKKEDVPWGYIVALILSLISIIATAYATYLANKRSKELAAARTELEQLKVDLAQKEHATQVAKEQDTQDRLSLEARVLMGVIQARTTKLETYAREHAARQKKLENLKAWEEINDA